MEKTPDIWIYLDFYMTLTFDLPDMEQQRDQGRIHGPGGGAGHKRGEQQGLPNGPAMSQESRSATRQDLGASDHIAQSYWHLDSVDNH